jgi:hypothetical protein
VLHECDLNSAFTIVATSLEDSLLFLTEHFRELMRDPCRRKLAFLMVRGRESIQVGVMP